MTASGSFRSADGTGLHYQWYWPESEPRAGVVIVHGYGDHAGRYAELGQTLAGAGLGALAFDYRGHGLADGPRGYCNRFEEYLEDLEAAWALATRALEGIPMGLVTHSHGALAALRLLCDPAYQLPGLAAIVISSPYLKLRRRVSVLKSTLGRVASRLTPRLGLSAGIRPIDLTRDPEILSRRNVDPLGHNVATARWYTEAQAAQAYVAKNLGRLAVPSLWLISGDDPIADPSANLELFARAGGDKHLRVYEGFLHESLAEVDRGRVFRDLLDWLMPRLRSQ